MHKLIISYLVLSLEVINSMPTGKAPGIDKISLRVIKNCLPAILPTLTSIINDSLVSGVFPSVWKNAEVTPIYKQGDHEKADNNHPYLYCLSYQRYVRELY